MQLRFKNILIVQNFFIIAKKSFTLSVIIFHKKQNTVKPQVHFFFSLILVCVETFTFEDAQDVCRNKGYHICSNEELDKSCLSSCAHVWTENQRSLASIQLFCPKNV